MFVLLPQWRWGLVADGHWGFLLFVGSYSHCRTHPVNPISYFLFVRVLFFWLQFDYLVVQMRPISCHLVVLRVLISVVDIFSCTVYGFSKVRGVNLGGWLVVEGWIKTSLFDEIPNGDMLVSTAHVVVGFANLGFLVS